MSITKNSFYTGEIYIPHAKPSITDGNTQVEQSLLDFIDDYERDALIKSLGYKLAIEFISNLDDTETNGLKSGADQKWDDLLNGKDYQDSDGDTIRWNGIRWKSKTDGEYDRSFLANYVYVFFENDYNVTRGNIGNEQEQAKNANRVSAAPKITKAFNKFIERVQGANNQPTVIHKSYGYGVDYYNGGEEISMYRFIQDMNDLDDTTYVNFNPKRWKLINQFGI